MHRGIATFTLDTGQCPRWLFERMVKLGREIIQILVAEFGPDEFIRRIGDPVWFQSLGTVLAFDWNASGLTTTLTAALKESIRFQERDLGIFICGGKGKTSLKTPDQISQWGGKIGFSDHKIKSLVYNSRMSAKVDSSLVQDGFDLYHHCFFFSRNGAWTVVQQGMNKARRSARRYHWYSDSIRDLINEPHTGIMTDQLNKKNPVLNLTAEKSIENRNLSVELIGAGFSRLIRDLTVLREHSSKFSRTLSLAAGPHQMTFLELPDLEFHHHPVELENFGKSRYLEKILWTICDHKPDSYEKFLAMKGVGPKTVRALSLISELIYGAPVSYLDPARYSFAHGGKDGTPYFVDRSTYDKNIEILKKAVLKMRLPSSEKNKIFCHL